MVKSWTTSGRLPSMPTILPVSPSDLVMAGSSEVPMEIRPPGPTCLTLLLPANRETTLVLMSCHVAFPPTSVFSPGTMTISSPTFRVPCIRDPPSTPHFRSLGTVPGELMSKDLATCIRAGESLSFSTPSTM